MTGTRRGILRDDHTFAGEFLPTDAPNELVKQLARADADRAFSSGESTISSRARRSLNKDGAPSKEALRRVKALGEQAMGLTDDEMLALRASDESLFWLLRTAQACQSFFEIDDTDPRSLATLTLDSTRETRNGLLLVGFMTLLRHRLATNQAHGRRKAKRQVLAPEARLLEKGRDEFARTGSQSAAARLVAKEKLSASNGIEAPSGVRRENPDSRAIERARGQLRRAGVFKPSGD